MTLSSASSPPPLRRRPAYTTVMTVAFGTRRRAPGRPPSSEDARRIPQVRRLVGARLRSFGLAAIADPMMLVTSELVTNALRHGVGGPVSVLLSCSRSGARVIVDDGFPEHRPSVRALRLDAEGGRGLFLVASMADAYHGAWGISSDNTRTWCTLSEVVPDGDGMTG
ncbi:ATP-binding protein [Streptomyces sp. NPDC051014]|uniref:ATP-binding protein n=1 Tax=Streptomyces sp. NPDC051014 TaxID=3155751 RepID=UPI0033F027B7